MARYDHLPIYRSIFRFCVEITKSVNLFSKANKYSLGQEIRLLSYELLEKLIDANNAEKKLQFLLELRTKLEKVTILTRLAYEIQAFHSLGNYEVIITHMADISRQLEGWIKKETSRAELI